MNPRQQEKKPGFFASIFGSKEAKTPHPKPNPKTFSFDAAEAAEALKSEVLGPFMPEVPSLKSLILEVKGS